MSEENVLYLRKSRADMELEAHGEMETLARHEKTLLDLAKRYKLNITAIYKEIVSGESISSRPEVQKLLTEVESGKYNSVLVMEVERLARGDTIDQGVVAQAFKKAGTKIITPLKTYDPNNEFDEEYFEFGLFMARREYKTINRRIQRGRQASVQEGKFIASQPPYGYDKVKIKDGKGYTLEANESADVVRLIYELYITKGLGATRIADELDRLHIKPLKTDTWHSCTIKGILSNPVYCGKIRWSYKKETKTMINGKTKKTRNRSSDYTLVDGLHEAIIDDDTFYKAQQIRNSRALPPVKGTETLKNPLTGLIFCGMCGTQMTRVAISKKTPYDTLKCPNKRCSNISAPLYLIEKKLLSSLDTWLKEYKLNLDVVKKTSSTSSATLITENILQQLESQMDKVGSQIENTHDLLEQGIYTKEKFLERNQVLSKRLSEIKSKYDSTQAEILAINKDKRLHYNIIPTVEQILDEYNLLPNASEKNVILKTILSKIEYTKTQRNTKGNVNNDNFELAITPVTRGIS